jgi:DNA (cytosine-5)-methyltransferase 1
MKKKIPVIDLFAGPGGLAEGFSSILHEKQRVFDIKLSIEKDESAHKTLELRSFCRQFPKDELPEEYYEVLKESDLKNREEKKIQLFEKFDIEYAAAKKEAWLAELGNKNYPPSLVDQRIKEVLKGQKDWVLIGGPPCQAFSLVGRSRVGGVHEEDHRVFLYQEYLRIIAEHQPTIFVMENVKGLLSASLNGEKIFSWILRDLRNPSSVFKNTANTKYKVYSLIKTDIIQDKDYLIKAEEYGIPQKRHRVILLGIREDLNVIPKTLNKKEKVTLKSVIDKLPKIRSSLNRKFIDSEFIGGKKKRRYKNLHDDSRIWENYINSFKKEIISWNGLSSYKNKKEVIASKFCKGSEFVPAINTIERNHPLTRWYLDEKLNGIPNHQSRSHLLEDLKRYMFAAIFTLSEGRFPRMQDYEKHNEDLLPDHKSATTGKFADRFRVQLPNEPATTVTSHISKDGHYFIHYDTDQCRSLTVREAARIQTFPDNYLFCGSRTAQYHQVGNAVPPYLSKQIGDIVKEILLNDE